jgi:L-lactate utilization protein LutC
MAKTNRKKGYRVAASPLKKPRKKSAADELIDRFGEIIETGAQKMNAEQLRKSEKQFNDAIDRAVVNKQRRGTA